MDFKPNFLNAMSAVIETAVEKTKEDYIAIYCATGDDPPEMYVKALFENLELIKTVLLHMADSLPVAADVIDACWREFVEAGGESHQSEP